MTAVSAAPNRLAEETSPYLRQHAYNPVEWYPWCDEALERAREEDKPILLSIGYSACHWCHVMAHESFEDPQVARVMNELFVNIKVDREERPDLDKIYQLSQQLLTQRNGGWPLTMFLTPDDRVPFFGGTYFPKEPKFGLPGFVDLLKRVSAFYREHREDIREQNGRMVQALQAIESMGSEENPPLDSTPLDIARQEIEQQFDPNDGGFGAAPKFPHPTSIERLLRHWAHTSLQAPPDNRAYEIAHFTLLRMGLGGVYDQLGGGFCRYSVDDHWMIPHFEKMLYDNGPLLTLYAEAWQAGGDRLYRRVAEETAEWVMREMQSPEGGYYSSLDADSEGEEGKFYTWTREEVAGLLTDEEYAAFTPRYGLDREPNFEGRYHLHVFLSLGEIGARLGQDESEVSRRIDGARRKLFVARSERVYPGRDEKVLTSWNGLMIKGMAAAGRRLGRPELIESAERALDFARTRLWRDGRLLATYKDGHAHLNAYLDDYVFMIDGALELLQARWRDGDLGFAVELMDTVLAHFEDTGRGGFYFTADDHESLIQRPRPMLDEATPSGNGVAAQVLGRLGHLLAETRYLDAQERTLRACMGSVQRAPHAHNAVLLGLEEHLYPPQTVILRGVDEALRPWRERCLRRYAPRRLTLAIPPDARDLPGVLAEREPRGDAVAYICTGTTCSAPITTLEALDEALAAAEPGADDAATS